MVFENPLKRGFLVCSVALLACANARADSIDVPITFDTNFIKGLLVQSIFTDSEDGLSLWGDESGCNDLTLSSPDVMVNDNQLHIVSHVAVRTGAVVAGSCVALISWQGLLDAEQEITLTGNSDRIEFRTTDSVLTDESGKTAPVSNAVWSLIKSNVHPLLNTLEIDLAPAITELRNLLPLFMDQSNKIQTQMLVDNLRLQRLGIDSNGITAELNLKVDPVISSSLQIPEQPAPAMHDQEIAAFIEVWNHWDAFLTFVVKVAARNSLNTSQREQLSETLLATRYRLVAALGAADSSSPDPVRESFIEAWQQLAPIFREISSQIQGQHGFRFLSFIAAADALQAIDKLGPVTGWDISVNGLRRLARLLMDEEGKDPLERSPGVDSEIRRLFDFEQAPETPADGEADSSSEFPLHWLLTPAHAGDAAGKGYRKLNEMAPRRENLTTYLPLVRELLHHTVDQTLMSKPLETDYHQLFRALVLATAWQETCWRQYREVNNQLEPVKSSAGAVGMMQIMPLVWRGFYQPELLANSIAYNAIAGTEILQYYLVRYAIRKGEDRHQGGFNNLARASYAAYNGGPRHLNRYRLDSTGSGLKEIDSAFWDKFVQIDAGKEMAVRSCYL